MGKFDKEKEEIPSIKVRERIDHALLDLRRISLRCR